MCIRDSDNIYQTLFSVDRDFKKLFKIKVEFEDDAPFNTENIHKLARFMAGYCAQEQLPPLTREAVAKVVEYASKLADDQMCIRDSTVYLAPDCSIDFCI